MSCVTAMQVLLVVAVAQGLWMLPCLMMVTMLMHPVEVLPKILRAQSRVQCRLHGSFIMLLFLCLSSAPLSALKCGTEHVGCCVFAWHSNTHTSSMENFHEYIVRLMEGFACCVSFVITFSSYKSMPIIAFRNLTGLSGWQWQRWRQCLP